MPSKSKPSKNAGAKRAEGLGTFCAPRHSPIACMACLTLFYLWEHDTANRREECLLSVRDIYLRACFQRASSPRCTSKSSAMSHTTARVTASIHQSSTPPNIARSLTNGGVAGSDRIRVAEHNAQSTTAGLSRHRGYSETSMGSTSHHALRNVVPIQLPPVDLSYSRNGYSAHQPIQPERPERSLNPDAPRILSHPLQARRASTAHESQDSNYNESDAASKSWDFLVESSDKFCKVRFDGWKAELDNLLVFTGLFSAVVTAFAVESYQWLQPNSQDTSAQLLAQISVQLGSLTVTPDFINSTVRPESSPAFSPDSLSVTINILWFLSLGLSLVSAFLALAVQQWLRAIPSLEQLSAQESIAYQHYRYDAFKTWKVPSIVMFLLVLLQIAVVLFVVGLYLLLRTLSKTAAVAFASVTGIPLGLYGMSLMLPLIWTLCPFKSPLVPALTFVARWILTIPLLILCLLMFTPVWVLMPFIILSWCFPRSKYYFSPEELVDGLLPLVARILQIGFDGKIGTFWLDREYKHLSNLVHLDPLEPALAFATRFIPPHKLDQLNALFFSLPDSVRMKSVLGWMQLSSSGDRPASPLVAARYQKYLLQSLPNPVEMLETSHPRESRTRYKQRVRVLGPGSLIEILEEKKLESLGERLLRDLVPLLVPLCIGQRYGRWNTEQEPFLIALVKCLDYDDCFLETNVTAELYSVTEYNLKVPPASSGTEAVMNEPEGPNYFHLLMLFTVSLVGKSQQSKDPSRLISSFSSLLSSTQLELKLPDSFKDPLKSHASPDLIPQILKLIIQSLFTLNAEGMLRRSSGSLKTLVHTLVEFIKNDPKLELHTISRQELFSLQESLAVQAATADELGLGPTGPLAYAPPTAIWPRITAFRGLQHTNRERPTSPHHSMPSPPVLKM